MKRPYRAVLDDAVRQHVPDGIDLFPRISDRISVPGRLRALLARPVLVFFVAIVALGLLSGVVYAVGRSLGYIPGVGIVEQGANLRMLAEPVVVEREGIHLSVTQGLASPDKTVINFQVDDIPESALAPDPREGETPAPRCHPSDSLLLPDGRSLSPTGGQGGSWGLGFRFRETYDPIPAEVNRVTLIVPCLMETSPGAAPEDWRIPLVFIPAPPDLTVVPVVEVTTSPPPTLEAETTPAVTPEPNPIQVERTIELEDGYILIGSFHSITTATGLVTSPYVWAIRITDAVGKDVAYQYASDIDLPSADESSSPWAYQIQGKDHEWPLTLTVDSLDATLAGDQATFRFDTGPAPQAGQQWTINQDFHLGDYTVRVLQVTRNPDGYGFSFQADPNVQSVAVDITGPDPSIQPAGGGGGGSGDGSFGVGVSYNGPIPEGPLTVVLRDLTIRIPGSWSIEWEPENPAAQAGQIPSQQAAACVNDEVWAQVIARPVLEMPNQLPGRFFVFGTDPTGTRSGAFAVDPLSGARQFLVEGSSPVVSPDGTKVVLTGDDGLAVYDMASHQMYTLPGIGSTDFQKIWSPDGSRIAFLRSSPNQIRVIDIDGSESRLVRDNSAVYHALVGWADSTHLVITEPAADGVHLQSIDLGDGSMQDLFSISSNKADTLISPDSQRIAFTTSLGGMLGNGLYVSRLDGSERRLVAALNGQALYFPVWSPDSRWLILSLPDPGDPVDQMRQALVELDTCRVIPLPDLGGDVYSWGP
jgi:hypothetical protein